MQLPALIQVGDDKWINPANICSFTDYGKRIEVGMMGSPTIMVRDEWLSLLRKAILEQIPDGHDYTTTTGTEEDTQDTEFTELTLCDQWGTCHNISKYEIGCVSKDGTVPDTECSSYPIDDADKLIEDAIDEVIALDKPSIDVPPDTDTEIEERRTDYQTAEEAFSLPSDICNDYATCKAEGKKPKDCTAMSFQGCYAAPKQNG